MKFLHFINLVLFVLFLASGCVPGPASTPTTTSSLPDLEVSHVYLGMHGVVINSIGCIPAYAPLEIRVTVHNKGNENAYSVPITELSSGSNLIIAELGAGQGIEVNFPISSSNAAYNVVVDPQNTIAESDENNNSRTYFSITPTPPALCTPTSAVSSLNFLAMESPNRDFFSLSTNLSKGASYAI